MKKGIVVLLTLALVILLMATFIGWYMSHVKEPDYKVVSTSGNIEIRQYAPMIIAQVEVEGEREAAIQVGFRLLADYIFGNNTTQQQSNEKIAMTAPVEQQSSEKIAMTAPVEQQSGAGVWKINFVMPSEYSMATLPKPNNQDVKLIEVPEKRFILIRFSGRATHSNLAKHQEQLMKYIADKGIKTIGAPKYAFYNPPWTLPFMRRNEILLELQQQGKMI